MKARLRMAFVVAGIAWLGTPSARAQMSMGGGRRSLGGYGASTIGSYYGGGGGYAPYMGNASGFLPYRTGQGGGMGREPARRSLAETAIGGATMARTPIGGGSLLGAVGNSRGGMGMRARSFLPFGYEGGIGMAGGMGESSMSRPNTPRRPSSPGFGYPFQLPTPLSGPTSMAMP
jgi:hypothetical protein